jgi:glycosyltransferase involved in cell wall biosynthesis
MIESKISPPLARRTWVVIAAYNESDRLSAVLRSLRNHGVENIIVVDDGSIDGTAAIATSENVWVLQHIINRGQGAALQTGIDFALQQRAEVVVTFDADGQHDASDLCRLLSPIENGEVNVVLGSRFLGSAIGVPMLRKLMLKIAVWGTRLLTGLPLTDTHNGLRAFSASAVKTLRMSEDGMAHASEFLTKLAESKLSWKEVPVTIHYTSQTLAKGQRNRAAFEIAFRVFVARLVR